jgi:hypothetical protein
VTQLYPQRYPGKASGTGFKRAAATGGAGFLGSHLCEALLDGGTRVVLDLVLHFSFAVRLDVDHVLG